MYIAETIQDFLYIRGLENDSLDLGVTFTYPVNQESLTEAYLIAWTKEFFCKGVIGRDIGKLLQDAFDQLVFLNFIDEDHFRDCA